MNEDLCKENKIHYKLKYYEIFLKEKFQQYNFLL